MWTRKELKAKAKAALKMNYWKTVLVALLVIVLTGGESVASSVSSRSSGAGQDEYENSVVITDTMSDEEIAELLDGIDESTLEEIEVAVPEDGNEIQEELMEPMPADFFPEIGIIALFILLILLLVVLAVALTLCAFLVNPLIVGASRFFLSDLNRPAEVKEVTYAFDHNYRETVKTMFWRDLYIILWGLLLVVPGIVKAYEYRMIPYLLAEDPTMTKDRAFAESKRMMSGQKWRTFVLDLSFIGWGILSLLTLGILYVFYVKPYKCLTDAALYERLHYGTTSVADEGRALPTTSQQAISVPEIPVPSYAAEAPQPSWNDEYDGSVADNDGADTPYSPGA